MIAGSPSVVGAQPETQPTRTENPVPRASITLSAVGGISFGDYCDAEVLERELARARRHGSELTLATLGFEPNSGMSELSPPDAMAEAVRRLLKDLPRSWVAARTDHWGVAVLAPATRTCLERTLLQALRPCVQAGVSITFGIAEFDSDARAETWLDKARKQSTLPTT